MGIFPNENAAARPYRDTQQHEYCSRIGRVMSATVLSPDPAAPPTIHSCPACSHWLPDGTLACPDCHTLTYGQYLGELAFSAQQLEQQQKWVEAKERWKKALTW